jgi:multicomponent Na+:H+ antiporter subunit E
MIERDIAKLHLRNRRIRDAVLQGLFLTVFWFLLSWKFDQPHIIFGAISVVAVLLLNYNIFRIQFFRGDIPEWERIRIVGFVRYLPWLLLEIVLASLQVAYVVLHPRMPIKPLLLRFNVKLPNLAAKIILGNSITLTPGTITIELKEDEFLVHALLDESIKGLTDGTMQTKVAKIFRKSVPHIVSNVRISRSME